VARTQNTHRDGKSGGDAKTYGLVRSQHIHRRLNACGLFSHRRNSQQEDPSQHCSDRPDPPESNFHHVTPPVTWTVKRPVLASHTIAASTFCLFAICPIRPASGPS